MRRHPVLQRVIVRALQDARRAAGLSQRSLSAKLGEVSNYIHMIEAMRRALPVEEFFVIADRCGADLAEMMAKIRSTPQTGLGVHNAHRRRR